MQINADDSLSPQQRKDQIAALAAQAKADLEAKLGSDGAGAFADSTNPWMRMLKNGQAFSTNRNDAPTDRYFGDRGRPVYPVAPPPPKK